jgi:CHAD domain-containing protein
MSNRIRPDEPVEKAIHRIASKHLQRALKLRRDKGDAKAIHEFRLRLKKTRALLKLVRSALGQTYHALNQQLRDEGRELSAARENQVLRETAKAVKKIAPSQNRDIAAVALRTTISRGKNSTQRSEKAARRIERLAKRLEKVSLKGNADDALFSGLETTYRRARQAWEKFRKSTDNRTLHECRKRAKDLGYQLGVLRNVCPEMLSTQIELLKRFTDLLGDHRDASLLQAAVVESHSDGAVDAESRAAIAILQPLQLQRIEDASRLAPTIFAETPRAFSTRVRAYWSAWRMTEES